MVITNANHAFNSLNPEKAEDFFAEGVSAVCKVKANLRLSNLESAVEAGAAFKALCPVHSPEETILGHEA